MEAATGEKVRDYGWGGARATRTDIYAGQSKKQERVRERQRSIETERSEDLQRGPLSIKLSADRYMCVRKLRETRGKTT